MLNDPSTLAVIFAVLINVALVMAALGQLVLIAFVITTFGGSRQQALMRAIAALTGLLIYTGARAAHIAVPLFLLDAMTMGGRFLAGAIGWMIPASVGFVVAWVVTSQFNAPRKHLVGGRLLAMLLAISFFAFADCLIVLGDASRAGHGLATLTPNILFAVSAMTVAIFRYKIKEADETAAAPAQAAE
jgi:hypothetical protein